ncbi:MAG TPA: cation diffusion facilitator family transporter [Candidatus Borkfalkia excrementigallinarum]|uniref:Cation diffusion facilitator family transporter n=1 Tax=Candidatus Borkfalkia excrementigallinarum TaxID=2838506 RepID=A0A9D1ZVE8_9FIRM|nr:cation diffusion facilitator family transporter [Candidatus Borkfalkia excrementigallinarum]
MNIFSKFLIKEGEKPASPAVRERAGNFSGGLGIALNTLLAGCKIAVGALTGMISVLADGMNNLTDCGSNVVSIIGFKMSGKPADKEHPFGHQRAESISALVIALIVLVVAVELAVQSVEKIITPAASEFSVWLAVVLGISVAVKLFMFFLNRALARTVESEALRATAADSISDAVATAAVLLALLISHWTGFDLDGYMGVAVAIFIAFTGGSILKETVSRLLGKAPDHAVIEEIEKRVLAFDGVHGLHDLTVHSYGQNKLYATVHVEVDSHMPIMEAHDLADEIEKNFAAETDIALTVHIDPLVLDDPKVNRYRQEAERIVLSVDPRFRLHDFRVVGGTAHSNLVFDVAVPFDCKMSETEILSRIRDGVSLLDGNLDAVVTVERQNLE